jgi:hypothetical protein
MRFQSGIVDNEWKECAEEREAKERPQPFGASQQWTATGLRYRRYALPQVHCPGLDSGPSGDLRSLSNPRVGATRARPERVGFSQPLALLRDRRSSLLLTRDSEPAALVLNEPSCYHFRVLTPYA